MIVNKCEICKKKPFHPDKKCCFNCTKSNSKCEVWHECGKDCPEWDNAIKTNADRIRAMSDEELATHLNDIGWDCFLCAEYIRLDNEPLICGEKCDEKCAEHCLEWLQQPAEKDGI